MRAQAISDGSDTKARQHENHVKRYGAATGWFTEFIFQIASAWYSISKEYASRVHSWDFKDLPAPYLISQPRNNRNLQECQYMEKISLCGDDCLSCPRYQAKTDDELKRVSELWYKVGWRNRVVGNDEIVCTGCSSHKQCTYHLVECIRLHEIDQCNECAEFPCNKVNTMLEISEKSRIKCKEVCTPEEYAQLEKAFFHKEINLKK